jgi:NAD(P)-dependent dehydrogenase (short-subunit alcohol dehydrogenase family)
MKKQIVVTGAGSGVGFELVLQLASMGHLVYALSRSRAKLEQLHDAAAKRSVKELPVILPCDITEANDIITLAEEMNRREARIDVLINNAGLLVNKPFAQLTAEDWLAVYGTNVFGAVAVIRALHPLMKRSAAELHSHIVNISSMGGVQGSAKFAGLSAYSSSKAAICGLSECLAEEFRQDGIHVNALALGSVQTEMFMTAFPGYEAATTPQQMAAFIAEFALRSGELFNGKVLPVSSSTP